ncbi:MAG: multidrug DMT transporter permease [Herbiconiux sp.]|uniref:DMT family transporter n=1 Tax=Herbiconiux sp. TaxID=1871186 RepID=UPI00120BB545|nr:DMT family transporter [Herbiconiux sp.]TAJ49667.1 MAG: multidrug DMT transporter permease [Herbiconiux sp.]
MPPELLQIGEQIAFDPKQFIGIPIALVGAVFLSLGAQFQHRGVAKVEARIGEVESGLNAKQMMALLARPSWVVGTLMLGLAVVFQLTSLGFSPIIVVQPLGAVALVITAVLNSRISKVKLNRSSVISIVLCVGGVGLFVLVAAFTAVDKPVTAADLAVILIVLAVVLVILSVLFLTFRKTFKALMYIVGAGVLYGFVATLAKVIISRLFQSQFDGLTILAVVGLLAAFALGGYFVQNAYASGPPDLVIAGLTVIDPLVAVAIGITVLGEASQAPLWALFAYLAFGLVAILGVFGLARYHPQAQR